MVGETIAGLHLYQGATLRDDPSFLFVEDPEHIMKKPLTDDYKDQMKRIFEETKIIICPTFPEEKVHLNAKGINHLLYKGNRSRRDRSRIETNLRLLPRAIRVLQLMPLAQEETSYTKSGEIYRFWTFEAVIEGRRIKVIVRQVGNGNKHFWSVIPAWRKDRFGVVNAKKRNLIED